MKKLIQFIQNVHHNNTTESAKRFYGGLGYTTAAVLICIIRHDLVDQLLYISAMLLGLETLGGVINSKISKK